MSHPHVKMSPQPTNPTEEVTTMKTDTNTNQTIDLAKYAAQAAVLAKIAKKEADEAFKKAQEEAIAALTASGQDSVELPDGTVVTVVRSEGRLVVDVEALADEVSAKVLDAVTKRSVDLDAFKGAVECGTIGKDVADKVTSLSPVADSLRVTAKAKKPAAK